MRIFSWKHSNDSNVGGQFNLLLFLVIIKNGRALGVQYSRLGHARAAFARKEVILSAGAIASPQLLMLSGVGETSALSQLGIPLQIDLPAVGQNLQSHVGTGELIFTVKKQGSTFSPLKIFTNPLNVLDYFLTGNGPLATPSGKNTLPL